MWNLVPRPKPPYFDDTTCWHACHSDSAHPLINGLCSPGVSRTDHVEAVSACNTCLHVHAVALSYIPPELGYRQRAKKPEPSPGAWKDDASGSTFHAGGEGDE